MLANLGPLHPPVRQPHAATVWHTSSNVMAGSCLSLPLNLGLDIYMCFRNWEVPHQPALPPHITRALYSFSFADHKLPCLLDAQKFALTFPENPTLLPHLPLLRPLPRWTTQSLLTLAPRAIHFSEVSKTLIFGDDDEPQLIRRVFELPGSACLNCRKRESIARLP